MIAAVRQIVGLGLAVSLLTIPSIRSFSDESPVGDTANPGWRLIHVPAGDPSAWPQGDWVPVATEMLRKAVSRTHPHPPKVWIQSANFQAVYRDGVLADGRMTATFPTPSDVGTGELVLLPWLNTNLMLQQLTWPTANAEIGIDAAGEPVLIVPPGAARLTGNWTLRGRTLSNGRLFDFKLPPAAISKVLLDVPREMTLRAPPDVIVRNEPSAKAGYNRWLILSGSRREFSIHILNELEPSKERRIFHHLSTSFAFSRDEFRIRQEIRLECPERSISGIDVLLPASIDVRQVFFGNTELKTWHVTDGPNRTLKITFSEPIRGQSRPLAIAGALPWTPDEPLDLVAPRPVNSTSLSEQVKLNILSPMELKTIRADGYRPTAVSSVPATSHSLTYQRLDATAPLRVSVGLPPNLARVRVATRIDTVSSPRSAECDLKWEMSSGERYDVGFQLAAGWELDDVKWFDSEAMNSVPLTDWFIERVLPDGRREVKVELSRSLNPDQPQQLQIRLRQSAVSENGALEVPLIVPVRAERDLHVVALQQEIPDEFASRSELRPVSWTALPDDIRNSPLYFQARNYRLFSVDADTAAPIAVVKPSAVPIPSTSVSLAIEDDRISERIECPIADFPGQVERLLIRLPSAVENVRWSIKGVPDVTVTPRVAQEFTDSPFDRRLWELELSPPQTAAFTLLGARTSTRDEEFTAALLVPRNTREFSGRVRMTESNPTPDSPPVNFNVTDIEAEALKSGVLFAGTYRSASAELTLPPRNAAGPVSEELRGILASAAEMIGGQWFLRNTLTLAVPRGVTKINIQVPHGMKTSEPRLNGQNAAWSTAADGTLTVKIDPSIANNSLKMRYDAPLSEDRQSFEAGVPLPKCDPAISVLEWQVTLPEEWETDQFLPGLMQRTPAAEYAWPQRIFGCLGRTASETIFNPARPTEWVTNKRDVKVARQFEDSTAESPFGWKQWKFVSNSVPEYLKISGWNRTFHSQLAWIALFASLLGGLCLRVLQIRFRAGLGAIWGAGVVALLFVVPDRFAECAGSLVTGTLFALLLPESLVKNRVTRSGTSSHDTVPSGSTHSRQLTGTVLVLVIACLCEPVKGQISPDSPPIVDVLVPSSATDDTNLPKIVYVKRTDYIRLFPDEVINSKNVLITSGEYDCEISSAGVVTLHARFECLLTEPKVDRIVIPLRGANLADEGACLVDARVAPVTLNENGYFQILLPDVARPSTQHNEAQARNVPLRARKPNEVPSTFPSRIVVELTLFPPVTSAGRERLIHLDLPPVPLSRISTRIPASLNSEVFIEGADGPTESTSNGLEIRAQLGQTSNVRLGWRPTSAADGAVKKSPQVSIDGLIAVDARLTHLEYRIHCTHRVTRGPVEFLQWTIPHDWTLRSVTSPDLLYQHIRTAADGSRTLMLDLKRPIVAGDEVVLDASFLCPRRHKTANELSTPIPAVFTSNASLSDGPQIKVNRLVAGIWAPPELSLTLVELPLNQLRSLPPDAFLARWPEANLPQPAFCYEILQAPVEPSFEYAISRPRRQVQGVQQKGVLRSDALDWEWSGEVVTSATSAFQHEFRMDPRLEILSVSAKEDDAERVSRWSVQDSQLTLLLNRKTEGRQQIQIKARLPVTQSGRLPLPSIRLLPLESTVTDLELSRTGAWEVEIDSPLQNLSSPGEGSAPGDRGLIPLGRFQVPESAELPVLVLNRVDRPAAATRTSSLELRADGQFELKVAFDVQPLGRSGRLNWTVPPQYAGKMKAESPQLELQMKETPTGSITLSAPVAETFDTPFQVEFRMTIDAPDADRWTIVLPQLLAAQLTSDQFSCRAADGWIPAVAADSGTSETGDVVTVVNGSTIELAHTKSVRDEAVPKIPLLLLWSDLEHNRAPTGRWLIFYEGSGRNSLEVVSSIPVDVTGCRVNGQPVETTYAPKRRLITVPIPPREGRSLIELGWILPQTLPQDGVDVLELPALSSEDLVISRKHAVILIDRTYRDVMHDGISTSTVAAQQLDLLETVNAWLEFAEEKGAHSVRLYGLAQALAESLQTITAGLSTQQLEQSEGFSRDRLDAALATAVELQRRIPEDARIRRDPDEPAAWAGLAEATSPANVQILSATNLTDASPRLWLVNEQPLAVVVGLICGLLSVPLLRWLFQLESQRRLGSQRGLPWLLLGLLWWTGLRFSAGGAVLTIAAAAWWLIVPRIKPATKKAAQTAPG